MRIPTTCGHFAFVATLAVWLVLSPGSQPAYGDQVSGTVTLDGRPAPNATLVIRAAQNKEGAVEVRTSDKGFYRVFLEPGRYQVILKDRPDDVLVLESLPAPVTRDLAFGRR